MGYLPFFIGKISVYPKTNTTASSAFYKYLCFDFLWNAFTVRHGHLLIGLLFSSMYLQWTSITTIWKLSKGKTNKQTILVLKLQGHYRGQKIFQN